jgi:hypothetical protein
MADEMTVHLRLTNSTGRKTSFVLEPWGDVHEFAPADEFLVVFTGPSPGDPQIDLTDEATTVWSWTGSTVRLFRNGVEVRNAGGPPVPGFPPSVQPFMPE